MLKGRRSFKNYVYKRRSAGVGLFANVYKVKVRKIQNEFMRSSFLPKFKP